MKVLLDENLPKRLKRELPMFELSTVREMGWSGKSNGELLRLMLATGFEAMLTFDRNMQHQQNFAKYPISVFVLSADNNDIEALRPLLPAIKEKLSGALTPGVTLIKEQL